MEKDMRKIGIHIVRQGNVLKVKVGKHKAELIPMDDTTQTYPFFAFAQWITETAVAVLEPIKAKGFVASDDNKQAAKSSLKLLGINDDTATDNVIRQIHEDQFGGR
jgi:helix-turn-helix protein